jgi:hypothetical protein
VTFVIFVFFGNVLLEWEVIGISDPAVVVGVFFMIACEVSRYPAVDWIT